MCPPFVLSGERRTDSVVNYASQNAVKVWINVFFVIGKCLGCGELLAPMGCMGNARADLVIL
jgi:hypothetical protein